MANGSDRHIEDGQGFIFVYDITSPASLEDLKPLYNKLQETKSPSYQSPLSNNIVLVGNKFDLGSQRQVSRERGKRLSEQWKCSHYETSAKARINVDEVFYDIVGRMIANGTTVDCKEANTDENEDEMRTNWFCWHAS